MAADLADGYVQTSEYSPFTKLPEDVDGFIEVETLVDIHKYLSTSEKSDDIDLAAWVKEHYLQGPLVEIGRPIRDTEGFQKLDRAYRRTRQLTGKAQDKWPFFNKNWKKMPSNVVKSAVHAANGTNLPVVRGEVRDTPNSNGFDGQHDHTSHISEMQKTHSLKDPARNETEEQKLLQLAPSLSSQQEPERKGQHQAPENSDTPRAGSVSKIAEPSTINGTVDSITTSVDLLRDAGAGKVRGLNGRYVNKSKPSPAAKKGPNIKYVKKSRTRAALEGESDEEKDSGDRGIKEPKALNSVVSGPSSDGEDIVSPTSSDPSQDVQVDDATVNASFPFSILAAEADAVPSNLDRLPPGIAGKKRKSEPAIQRGGLKRARGSRGGVLGRPRKSEPIVADIQPEAEEGVKASQLPPKPDSPAKAATRRSSRKSAAVALETSTPWNPADDVLLNGAAQEQPVTSRDKITVNGVGGAPNNIHYIKKSRIETEVVNGVDERIRIADKETMNGDSYATPTSTPVSQTSKPHGTPTSSKQKKRVSFLPEIEAGKVEFFARISTSVGTQEVPLSREDLTSEVDLVERYAAWQDAGNADVTFDVFKKIVIFTR